jgi:predicted Zn finger-like uncharacterized protein
MPTVVACPECHSKLRVPDGLSGQAVRCARCGTTFTAPEIDLLNPVDLPLVAEPPAGPTPFPAPPARPPVPDRNSPLDLRLSLDDEPPLVARPASDPPPARPILNDEDEDLRECPHCGKQIHREHARCPFCGDRLSRPPARRRRRVRADAEPHRAGLVLTLGIMSLVGIGICIPAALILGPIAWVLGRNDLSKMKHGQMDTEGEGSTQAGWICGIVATLLSWIACFGLGLVWMLAFAAAAGGAK